MTQQDLAVRAGISVATLRTMENGKTQSPYKLRDVLRALGLEEAPTPLLASAADEELIKELGRRYGRQTADVLRGYLEAKRADEATDPDTSQSGNDAAGDNAAS